MSRNLRTFIFALIVVLGLTWSCLAVEPTTEVEAHDALKSYVERPDDSYGWTVRQRTRLGQSDCIELTLTSQTWEQIVWKHRLFLIVPDGVQGQTDALLVIEGGVGRIVMLSLLIRMSRPIPKRPFYLRVLPSSFMRRWPLC